MTVQDNCLAAAGVFFCSEGISAAYGAASGALGYTIITQAGWAAERYTLITMTQSMAIGAPIFACPISCCIGFISGAAWTDNLPIEKTGFVICTLTLMTLSGPFQGMAGAKILGLIGNNTHLGYVAAAGATGSSIVGISTGVAIAFLVCTGLANYIYCVDRDANAHLIEIPAENITQLKNGEPIPLDEIMISSIKHRPTDLGINIGTQKQLAKYVTTALEALMLPPDNHAPVTQEDMSRNITRFGP